mmetsp:Transcript_22981/g.29356  ORF Transcript_22981/g.29356 Transcript_22981/m.29356 type:complete len:313 (-) Transcript_22981:303-1241(-)
MDLGKELRQAVRENNLGEEETVYVPMSAEKIGSRGLSQFDDKLQAYVGAIREIISSQAGGFDEADIEDAGYDFYLVSLVSNFEVEGEHFGESTEETRRQGHSFVEKKTGNLYLVDSDPATGNDVPAKQYGIRGNIFDSRGGSSFLMKTNGALRVYQCSVIELVSCLGADVNAFNEFGETALMQAASFGYVDICKWLTKLKDVNLNQQSNSLATALMKAVESPSDEHVQVTKMLLHEHANPNIQNKWGITALHIAAFIGNLEACKLLLEHNADKTIQDSQGNTPIDYSHEDSCDISETNEPRYNQELEKLLTS